MGGGNAESRMEELLQNARSANVLSGLFEEDGRNSRRGRKPLSAGDAGIGKPNGGFKGLAFACCILAEIRSYLSLSKDLLGSAPRMRMSIYCQAWLGDENYDRDYE
jgi:hypothetical protein